MNPHPLQCLIFDVDGTLADTETVHLAAFNQAFADLGMDWYWDEALYTRLLEISGGKERVQHYWQQMRPDVRAIDAMAVEQTVARIHEIKTAHYEAAVNDGAVQLRPGVLALIEEAAGAGLQLAIATTTSPVNIAALLRRVMGSDWRSRFVAVQDASSAPLKKPHPMVYQQTLAQLGLPAAACLAFEDSANGLRSALAAGLATVITPTHFTAHHDFAGALRVLPSLEGVGVDDLRAWRAAA